MSEAIGPEPNVSDFSQPNQRGEDGLLALAARAARLPEKERQSFIRQEVQARESSENDPQGAQPQNPRSQKQTDLIEQVESLVALLEETTQAPIGQHSDHSAKATNRSPAANQSQAADPSLPSVQGFELKQLIGHGGMGSVYRARQLEPSRLVAIKLIRADLMSPEAQARLGREADLLARLNHPGIARLFAAGTASDSAHAHQQGVIHRSANGVMPQARHC